MDPGIFWLLTFVTAIPAAIASFPLEHKRRKSMPSTKPYTWGIYLGLNTLLLGALLVGLELVFADQPGFWSVGGIAYVVAGYAALRRYRLGMVFSVLLSINIAWWVVGSIYIWNRWSELRGRP